MGQVVEFVESDEFKIRYLRYRNDGLDIGNIKFKVAYLASGEYNSNYRIMVYYGDEKIDDMVFRINYASQMSLENQIGYEFAGLEAVETSGVTPIPYFYDDSKSYFPREYLVMSYIDGDMMDYERDMSRVVECLVSIHSLPIPDTTILIQPDSPFGAILDEAINMYSKYTNSEYFDKSVDSRVQLVFDRARKICSKMDENLIQGFDNKSIINTELNSSNFIVGEKIYLVDWEKPIIGEKEQDLGHFLAPTTSFWKTDIIFTKSQLESFLREYYDLYKEKSANSAIKDYQVFRQRVYDYIIMNCLRGITWCAMAWVEYNQAGKSLINEFTYNKLKDYLSIEYLDMVVNDYIK